MSIDEEYIVIVITVAVAFVVIGNCTKFHFLVWSADFHSCLVVFELWIEALISALWLIPILYQKRMHFQSLPLNKGDVTVFPCALLSVLRLR